MIPSTEIGKQIRVFGKGNDELSLGHYWVAVRSSDTIPKQANGVQGWSTQRLWAGWSLKLLKNLRRRCLQLGSIAKKKTEEKTGLKRDP